MIANKKNDDFTIKFINHNTRTAKDNVAKIYQKTIETKKERVIQECIDFSKIPSIRKQELIDKVKRHSDLGNKRDITVDNFIYILITKKTLIPSIIQEQSKPKNYATVTTYSIKHVRELLFLYKYFKIEKDLPYNSYMNKQTKLLPNITHIRLEPTFEQIDLINSIYNIYNIKEVTNKLILESIQINFDV